MVFHGIGCTARQHWRMALECENSFHPAVHYRRHSPLSCRIAPLRDLPRGQAVIEYVMTYFAVFTVLAFTLLR
jgi:hypothetical protein